MTKQISRDCEVLLVTFLLLHSAFKFETNGAAMRALVWGHVWHVGRSSTTHKDVYYCLFLQSLVSCALPCVLLNAVTLAASSKRVCLDCVGVSLCWSRGPFISQQGHRQTASACRLVQLLTSLWLLNVVTPNACSQHVCANCMRLLDKMTVMRVCLCVVGGRRGWHLVYPVCSHRGAA